MKKLFSLGLIFVLAMSLSLFAQDTIKLKTLGRSPLTEPVTNEATVRASLAFYNTREELDALAAALHQVIEVFS